MPVEEFGYDAATGEIDLADLEAKLDEQTACVIVQSPNFFGVIEDVKAAAAELRTRQARCWWSCSPRPCRWELLEPPREADIVAGELQSFAISPSYGGPYAGIIATQGEVHAADAGPAGGRDQGRNGNRAFCLTLSTREQHIRREKATSNICTNQALIALMATVFMSVYGKQGLRELADAEPGQGALSGAAAEAAFQRPFFNEFVVTSLSGRTPEAVNAALLEQEDHRRPAARPLLSGA